MMKQHNPEDAALRERARRVIPAGMYGHGNVAMLPEGYPQFFERGHGCRIVDVDGKIAYTGAPGPWGFKPREVEEWLKGKQAEK